MKLQVIEITANTITANKIAVDAITTNAWTDRELLESVNEMATKLLDNCEKNNKERNNNE